jgi:hypothetical protein
MATTNLETQVTTSLVKQENTDPCCRVQVASTSTGKMSFLVSASAENIDEAKRQATRIFTELVETFGLARR